jgi:hypothetical protein
MASQNQRSLCVPCSTVPETPTGFLTFSSKYSFKRAYIIPNIAGVSVGYLSIIMEYGSESCDRVRLIATFGVVKERMLAIAYLRRSDARRQSPAGG